MSKVIQGKNIKGKWSESEVEDSTVWSKEDVIKLIGEEHWKQFSKWMNGQGCPVLSNKELGYWQWDVEKWKRHYIDGVPQLMREDIEEIFKEMDKEKEKKEYVVPVKKKGKI